MKRLLLVGLTGLLVGCGTTRASHVMLGQPGPPHERNVRIAMEGQEVPAHYVEVALIQAVGRGWHADLEHVIEGLRREAARLGCDGVIRVQVDQGSSVASATGVAIRVQEGPPPAPVVPPPTPAPATSLAPSQAPAPAIEQSSEPPAESWEPPPEEETAGGEVL